MKLVNKIASLMTEAGNKWFHRSAGRLISVKAAKNIQKRAYENSFCSPDESCTPVYREIALQLEDKNEQVFRAAVYNLYKIARGFPPLPAGDSGNTGKKGGKSAIRGGNAQLHV